MAPMKSVCFAIGLVASAMGKAVVPGSAVYTLQGGASGLETDGDYIENKIARGVSSVFGVAADMPNKIGRSSEDKEVVTDDRRAVTKFFGDPNNAFVAQAVTALVFGGLHIAKYVEFIDQFTSPVSKMLGLDYAAEAFGPHVRVVGAFLAGILVSDVLAYKSTSAGFKRGKIWHEMGSCIAIAAVCLGEFFADEPADMVPHAIAAVAFAGWYSYLSQQY